MAISFLNNGVFSGNLSLTGNLDVNLGEVQMTDGYSIQWGGNAILNHSGTATTIGDNTSSSILTLSGGNATFAGSITATLGTFSSTTDQILNLNSTDNGAVYTAFKRNGSRIGYVGYGGSGATLNINNELDGIVLIQNTNGFFKLNTNGSATFSGAGTFAGISTASSFTSSTDSGININGITLTRIPVNSAIRVSQGLETLGLLRSYAGINVAQTATFGGNATIAGKVMLGSGTPVRKLELRNITGARNFGIGFNDKDGTEQGTIAVDHNTNDIVTAAKANMRFFSGSVIGNIATLPTNQTLVLTSSQNARFTSEMSANTVISRDNLFVDAGQLYIGADDSTTDNTYRQSVSTSAGSFTLQKRISGTFTDVLSFNNSNNATFTGLVSGITPVNAANFVTKAYVDGSGGGTGPFLPLAGGTMTAGAVVTFLD